MQNEAHTQMRTTSMVQTSQSELPTFDQPHHSQLLPDSGLKTGHGIASRSALLHLDIGNCSGCDSDTSGPRAGFDGPMSIAAAHSST